MRVFLNTDTKTIVTAFSGSILGWIGGSVIAGIFYEQLNPEIQLSLAVLVMAIMTGIAPWTDSLLYFIMVMTTQGIGAGYIDAGKHSTSSFPRKVSPTERTSTLRWEGEDLRGKIPKEPE